MFTSDLIQRLTAISPKNEVWYTPIQGLTIHCCDQPTQLSSYIQEPSICIVLQQRRQICNGGECYLFGQGQFMFCPVNLPVTIEIPQATENEPYLGISMKIDLQTVAKVLAQLPKNFVKKAENQTAFGQWQISSGLENAFSRLLILLETPNDIGFLAPLIQQEIYYRLLQSDQGEKLQNLLTQDSHTNLISRAAIWIERNLSQSFTVEMLAYQSGMSVSGFHNHFKKVTGMSPLQYQKRLRLTEAQKLIKQGKAISETAYEVGYESPSQFSREYKRYFGLSPSNKSE
ncbi:AraC family transcriptional regulator [Mannheimia granulomatis]|uniref:AraC family transcriptional regulator n=1 Tax=Mannheimia granulomatis TaxID=85402 RepID=UPI00047B5F0D|nr:AraC family transcriptional regulator [Mannheimia granulomatis]QLB18778.1 AraC family transcriptional regulator [Mannheimia granulomatis]